MSSYPNAGFPPIVFCEEEVIKTNYDKKRQFKSDIKTFSIRTILNKPKQNIINLNESNDTLNEI